MPSALNTVRLGNGEVASLVRTLDCSSSPLGPPENWPQALRSIVSLILNSKFPMFIAWGPELAVLYNDAYIEIAANKHPAALGQPFSEVWSEIWDDISPIVDKALAGESSYFEDLPLTMLRKGYEERTWFTFSYSPIYDETGKVAGMYCACTETTEQVLAERRRTNENERLRDLFQQAPGIMAVMRTPEHVFELANDAYYQLVGHREILGKSAREALPEVEGQGLFELLDRVYMTGEPYIGREVRVKLRRQSKGELEERFANFIYQPIRDGAGRVSGIFVEGSDVTEAVKATRALRGSEQQLRQLANTIPHLAWMANPDGWVHWYNDRWYEYTGSTFEQMEGWGWQTAHDAKKLPQVVEAYKTSLGTGKPFEMIFPLRSAAGEYRTFYTRAAPLHDSAGNIVQWFGTNTDIHEIEKAQQELRLANRRKDEFLAMLAHELRNPLAPISTAAELLKLATLDPKRMRSTSSIIARQVAHMTQLVDDLLDVSRVTRGLVTIQAEPVNLKDILAEAIEQVNPLMEQKRQHLSLSVGEEAVMVSGDKTRLTQVFSNILNNASKYTPEQGHITLHLRVGEEAEVDIEDDGIGIEPHLLPTVFELFTQAERSPDRSQGGLGLGLALTKSLVELHGGSVSAHSEGPGKGSRFSVTLPRLGEEAVPPPSESPLDSRKLEPGSFSLLVVDDNTDAAETLTMLLEIQGYRTSVAYNGADALKRVANEVPQAMVLDIGLPDMDGYELARRLQSIPGTANSVLIALTGYGQSRDREQSKAAGFAHHLVKPVDTEKLMAILDGARAQRAKHQKP